MKKNAFNLIVITVLFVPSLKVLAQSVGINDDGLVPTANTMLDVRVNQRAGNATIYTLQTIDLDIITSNQTANLTGLDINFSDGAFNSTATNIGLNVDVSGLTGGTNYAGIFMGGSVGIGTTPTANVDLELGGDGKFRILSTTDLSTPATGKGLEMYFLNVTDKAYINSVDQTASTYKELSIYASAITVPQGKVGIGFGGTVTNALEIGTSGTTTDQLIDVTSQANAGLELIADPDNNSSGTAYVRWSQDNTATQTLLGTVQTASQDPKGAAYTGTLANATLLGTLDANALQIGTNDNVRMTVASGGNVGIGTSSPDASLDVNGNASFATDNISIGSTTGAAGERANISYNGTGARFTIKGLTGVNTSIGANGTDDYLYIKNDGNVGIGISNPAALLDITGDGSTILLPRKSTAGDPTGANGMLYYNSNSNKFRAFENSTWTNLIGGGGGANTLDQAYDQGGAGAGRIIAADAGPVTITGTGVVTANQGRMHVTTVGGTAPTPSAAISGSIGTAGSIGYGLTGEITNSDNSGAAIFGSSNGTGQTINANMTGTGVAGRFDVSNAGNAFSAVTGTTNGSGSAILGRTTGTGRAGEFNNTNAANATETIYSSTNNPAATAALFENVAAAGAGLGAGLRGRSTQSAGVGVIGSNFHASGTGTAGAGNNQGPLTLAAGSGVSGTSDNVGVFGVSTSAAAGKMGGLFWLGTGATVYSRVAYNNAGTGYGIFSNFTKSTVVKGLNGEDRIMFCPEAPEILFEDYGKGQLVNGFSHIELDPIFANTVKINSKHPLRVFIQLEGDCNGVYVTAKSATGFDVIELSAGKSNTAFMYHVIANRIDATDEEGNVISIHEALRFPIGPDSAEDQQLLPLPKKEGKRNLSKMQKPQFPKNR